MQFLLLARNLLHQLSLVESLLSDDLATQVLNLCIQSLLDCVVLLSHDLSPDRVQLVQNSANAPLIHYALVLVPDLQDDPNSLCRDPIVVFGIFSALGTISLSRLIEGLL